MPTLQLNLMVIEFFAIVLQPSVSHAEVTNESESCHPREEECGSMTSLRGTWMRGGTSKCWLFNAVDVDPLLRHSTIDSVLATAFGAGDPLQLDGVGGGTSTTSKAAIVRRSLADGVDVDYLFAQVAIGQRTVEWG